MTIVRMQAAHAEAVAALETVCFHEPWSAHALEETRRRAGNIFLAACDGAEVLGYVGCQTVLDEGYITNVAVSPAARRRGIARQLLARLAAEAEAMHLVFLTLEVRASNAAAIALYAGEGYKEAGVRKGFYRDPQEDAVLMTRYFKADDSASARIE